MRIWHVVVVTLRYSGIIPSTVPVNAAIGSTVAGAERVDVFSSHKSPCFESCRQGCRYGTVQLLWLAVSSLTVPQPLFGSSVSVVRLVFLDCLS